MGRVVAGIEVEVIGTQTSTDALPLAQAERLCIEVAAAGGVTDGHMAIEYVNAERIAQLNAEYRGKNEPTDVLSFPLDGVEAALGGSTPPVGEAAALDGGVPRELGDVVICPEHTADIVEAIVHGTLHLVGMDHETDNGEMLALQAEIVRWEREYDTQGQGRVEAAHTEESPRVEGRGE